MADLMAGAGTAREDVQVSLWAAGSAALFSVGICLSTALLLLSPPVGILCALVLFTVAIAFVPLRTAVLIALPLIAIDIQRQVNGTWIFLDLGFIALLVPLIRTGWPPWRSWLLVPYWLWFAVTGVSRAMSPEWFWGACIRFPIAVILGAAVASCSFADEPFLVLGVTTAVLVAFGIYQMAAHQFTAIYAFLSPHELGEIWTGRAQSVFWQVNVFGGFCAIMFVALLTLADSGLRRRLYLSLAATALLGTILSGSRGALMGAFAGAIVVEARRIRPRHLVIGAVMAALIATAIRMDPSLLSLYFGSSHGPEDASRLTVWAAALLVFLQHPIAGVGLTNFAPLISVVSDWQFNPVAAHNLYLQLLAENGVIGFALFFTPIFYLLRLAWKDRADNITRACLGSIVVLLVHGLVDYMFTTGPQYQLLVFVVIGVLVGRLHYLSSHRAPQRLHPRAISEEAF